MVYGMEDDSSRQGRARPPAGAAETVEELWNTTVALE